MEDHVFRVVKNGEENVFRVNVKYLENGFDITVFKNDCAWRSNVDRTELKNLAQELGSNEDDYHENVSGLFKNAPEDLLQFNNSEFVIYKNLEKNIRVKYFQCKLKKVNFNENVYTLLDKIYNDKVQLSGELQVNQSELNNLKLKNAEYEANLNEFVNRKNSDDNELLNKFVTILNEKKRRIQHLTELLDAFQKGSPILGNAQIKRKQMNHKNDTAESGPDQSDSDTDVENSLVPLKMQKLEETPSTSKQQKETNARPK